MDGEVRRIYTRKGDKLGKYFAPIVFPRCFRIILFCVQKITNTEEGKRGDVGWLASTSGAAVGVRAGRRAGKAPSLVSYFFDMHIFPLLSGKIIFWMICTLLL
jgi:hypothetical protein